MIIIRQAKLLVLMICLVFLSACGAKGITEEEFNSWREGFITAQDHEITADVTFSSGDKVCIYTLKYGKSADSETIEVLAPEQIAEIKANITGEDSEVLYDGAVLETGTDVLNGLSPMTSLPTFMDFLKDGHVESIGKEIDEGVELIVTDLELADGSKMTLWQSKSDMTAVAAAIRSSDKVEAKIQISEIK